jgi:ATP-dependent DNA helicase RecG
MSVEPGPGVLDAPLKNLVGDRTAKVLAKNLGLLTAADLLRHYPRRYPQRGELTDLADLQVDTEVTILAEIATVSRLTSKVRRGARTELVVTDGRSNLLLTFFNQPWRADELRAGRTGLFSGKITAYQGRRQLAHPDYQLLEEEDDAGLAAEEFASALIPIYRSTKTMESWKIARCVALLLDTLPAELPDPVPAAVRARHRLLGLRQAFEQIHRPVDTGQIAAARHRLTWDEALPLQAVLAQRRLASRAMAAVPRVAAAHGVLSRFDARLPFTLTAGQGEVSARIAADLAEPHPMHRLLQGEVGSGKTVVALRAMLTVVDAGGQAVLLAPTEVLAHQHLRSITDLLGPLARGGQPGGDAAGTRVALLTGSQGAKERRANLLDAASGAAGIVVGTHAVIEEAVQFADLGLVVIDEQHRFGVEQRDALRAKAKVPPHLLVMTATPIPRTVAMTVFGDLETSMLTELPSGRSPIATHVVPAVEKPHYLERTWGRIRDEVAAGHQAYIVCPRIGGGEQDGADGAQSDEAADYEPGGPDGQYTIDDGPHDAPARRAALSVVEVARLLTGEDGQPAGPLAGLRTGILHGRLPSEEKDAVMTAFAEGRIDVLIATTVIEVGVNVPNATVMAVLDADRFGISQLHQLRGRVGRGSAPGWCLLVTESAEGSAARERLDAVAATTDGFELSRRDLELRREGDVLGATQSGHRSSLRLLGVIRDEDLIVAARQAAHLLVERDPRLEGEPALAAAVAALADTERAQYLEKT